MLGFVRPPGLDFAQGLTSHAGPGPDYELALNQHAAYCKALQACGVRLVMLDELTGFPDACFIEDTALVLSKAAIMLRPGHPTRQGEVASIAYALGAHRKLQSIEAPGTVDGGDLVRAEKHIFIGRSARTNAEGAAQLSDLLTEHGYTSSEVPVEEGLHLKSGVSYIGENRLVLTPHFAQNPAFRHFDHIVLQPEEGYAANCIMTQKKLIIADKFPVFQQQLAALDIPFLALDMSEFRKMDG
ncbi:MAG: arginine deiminase-related protein, partial [Bacteroidota bacterium]